MRRWPATREAFCLSRWLRSNTALDPEVTQRADSDHKAEDYDASDRRRLQAALEQFAAASR